MAVKTNLEVTRRPEGGFAPIFAHDNFKNLYNDIPNMRDCNWTDAAPPEK